MASNFFLEPSDPAFKAHKGYFSKQGLTEILGAYDKYVTNAGRNVPKELWVGTVAQESGFGKYKEPGYGYNPMFGAPDKKFQSKIAKERYYSQDKDYNMDTDFAAHKLHEGMAKFNSPEKAARWYNYYDKVPREKLPQLGRDVLNNPVVQEIVQRLSGYTGQQYRDKLKASDKPLEGGFF